MDFSQVIKDALRPELIRFEIALRKSVENDNRWISAIINHVLSAEGKRIRPMLVFLTAKSCGGVTPATYYGAVTIELLHTASLIHDDILDESSVRRGQPSVNAVFGNHQAVLSGDYLLSTALRESVKPESRNC
jgi:octaprenyl-diphosphate synthase